MNPEMTTSQTIISALTTAFLVILLMTGIVYFFKLFLQVAGVI